MANRSSFSSLWCENWSHSCRDGLLDFTNWMKIKKTKGKKSLNPAMRLTHKDALFSLVMKGSTPSPLSKAKRQLCEFAVVNHFKLPFLYDSRLTRTYAQTFALQKAVIMINDTWCHVWLPCEPGFLMWRSPPSPIVFSFFRAAPKPRLRALEENIFGLYFCLSFGKKYGERLFRVWKSNKISISTKR